MQTSSLCECTATAIISLVGRTDMLGVGCRVCSLGKEFQSLLLHFLAFPFHLWTPEMHSLLTQIPGNHVELRKVSSVASLESDLFCLISLLPTILGMRFRRTRARPSPAELWVLNQERGHSFTFIKGMHLLVNACY